MFFFIEVSTLDYCFQERNMGFFLQLLIIELVMTPIINRNVQSFWNHTMLQAICNSHLCLLSDKYLVIDRSEENRREEILKKLYQRLLILLCLQALGIIKEFSAEHKGVL